MRILPLRQRMCLQSNPITCFSVDNKTVIEEITNEINGKEEE